MNIYFVLSVYLNRKSGYVVLFFHSSSFPVGNRNLNVCHGEESVLVAWYRPKLTAQTSLGSSEVTASSEMLWFSELPNHLTLSEDSVFSISNSDFLHILDKYKFQNSDSP